MASTLYKRIIIETLIKYLYTNDIIVIHGARQVGKTSILMYLQQQLQGKAEKTCYIDLEDNRYTSILDQGVDNFLTFLREEGYPLENLIGTDKKLFVLIDEIQYLADPSPFLKLLADHHHEIKLIISGSSSFEMKGKFSDSLVGRTVNFEIYPLSFRELLIFRGVHFIPKLQMTDKKVKEIRDLYEEYALYGGYPKIVLTSDVSMKEKYLQQIIDTYIRKDIRDLAEIKEVTKFNNLVALLASQSGNLLNITEISNTTGLAKQTVERYLFLLEQTYIIRLVHPYSRNLRTELFRTPKVFFYDTGLLQMLWLKRMQRELLGSVFETSVFSELVKLYSPEQIGFWRTKDKKEIDFILYRPEGVLPIEAKLQFTHSIPTALKSFWKYGDPSLVDFRLVGLNGTPNLPKMIYPWEL
ncbi:MAG: hypothetical protein A2029_10920 [Chloroflexi bacterium RBG_19FT_COMBO_47_9]|nr:MAG: hypothetical protein A2029_10920 [Chloroflexi bacterium RBG_19FT_COMBO_47_9]